MISADVISRAIYDKPVQPLFNTIYMQSLRAGIPVVVTNTNNNLKVTAKASVGSIPIGTALTDAMFNASKSGIEVDGYQLYSAQYYTLLDLDSNISELPNEFRTDAAGMDDLAFMEVLVTIGNRMSEQIMKDFFSKLQGNIATIVPSENVHQSYAGKIEWNTTVLAPASGKTAISALLDDIQASLPLTMKPGGAAGDIVTAWISAQDFSIMENSTVEAFQYNKNGGITPNQFVYVKAESTIDETRNLFAFSFMRRNNIIIRPWNGLKEDTIIVTYQEGIKNERVFFEKVPADLRNNLYIVLKGAFVKNPELTVPMREGAQTAFFNLPYQVGNLFAINKVENAVTQYKVIGNFSSGPLLRESDKLFAYLPNAPVV